MERPELGLYQTNYVESFPFRSFLFIHLFYISQTILHLLQLFGGMLRHCFVVKHHRCFVDLGTSPNFPYGGGSPKTKCSFSGGTMSRCLAERQKVTQQMTLTAE